MPAVCKGVLTRGVGSGKGKCESNEYCAALRSLAPEGRLCGSRADEAAKAAWKKDVAKDGVKQ